MDLELFKEEMQNIKDNPAKYIEGNMFGQLHAKTPILGKYIKTLKEGSIPEVSVKELVKEVLKYFYVELLPKGKRKQGVIDYYYKDKITGRKVDFEFKPFIIHKNKKWTILELNPKMHIEQAEKYLSSEEANYLILTNAYDCYLYSLNSLRFGRHFKELSFVDFLKKLDQERGNLIRTLRKLEEGIRVWTLQEMEKKLLSTLKDYYKHLKDAGINGEVALKLINTLLFAKNLEDNDVIPYLMLKKSLERYLNLHGEIRSRKVLELFFLNEIRHTLWDYYDTDLFYWKEEEYKQILDNSDKVLNVLKKLFGLIREELYLYGLYSYDFRSIDVDVLGSSYKTFLATENVFIKKTEGIFYTPSYISNYLVEKALQIIVDPIIREIKLAVTQEEYEKAQELIEKLKNIKFIDPACGSGSFLVKVYRKFWKRYKELFDFLHGSIPSTDLLEDLPKKNNINNLLSILKEGDIYEFYKKICERHIYGIDKDLRAIKIAKLNLWKEILRLDSKVYSLQKIKDKRFNQVFPSLENNFLCVDALYDKIDGFPREFDAVIGNPPYGNLLSEEAKSQYSSLYSYSDMYEIASIFVEKGVKILKKGGLLAYLITHAITFNKNLSKIRELIATNFEEVSIWTFDRDRCNFFEGEMTQSISMLLAKNKGFSDKKGIWTSNFYRSLPSFKNELEFISMLENQSLSRGDIYILPRGVTLSEPHRIAKIGSKMNLNILEKLYNMKYTIGKALDDSPSMKKTIWIRTSGNYWYNAWNWKPYESSEIKSLEVPTHYADLILLIINSSLFYFWFRIYGDGRHMNMDIFKEFPLPNTKKYDITPDVIAEILTNKFKKNFDEKRKRFFTSNVKPVLDMVDIYLGFLYDLQPEEIYYIIRYDSEVRGGTQIEQSYFQNKNTLLEFLLKYLKLQNDSNLNND